MFRSRRLIATLIRNFLNLHCQCLRVIGSLLPISVLSHHLPVGLAGRSYLYFYCRESE